jgi:para-nitrobenzyl esterase
MAVSVLMASPQAKGLVHRAIGESGSAFTVLNRDESLSNAEAQGLKFMQSMSTTSLAKLRQRSSAEILSMWKAPDTKWSFRPIIDGWVLPASVGEIFKAGKQNDVPLLAGWNTDEGFTSVGVLHSRKLAEVLAAQFGNETATAMKFYPSANDEEERRSRILYAGDITIAQSTWKWAVAQSTTGKAPVYLFQFDHHPPVPDDWFGKGFAVSQSGAFHSAEISYVFDHPEINPTWKISADDHKVADEMSSHWIQFMKTGNPNMDGSNIWPTYNLKDPKRMVLSTSSRVEKDIEVERRKFLDTAPVPADF